nr:sphingomyelin phosphodiesterase 2 [Pelodiscus sinensis]|eukprot:XP_014425327.1 sphingomyelin phosphodiesterase 2 [Pelodiscus sinensis]
MDTEPPLQLRIFDLNCWAIRYLSKLRQERIGLIGDTLSQEGFDLALLQEVWSERDYCELKQKLAAHYPYSHYFKSGVIGSGLCVFSKYPILDTFLYQYSLNGYPYMLQHGDWFCGKAVGLLVIKICGVLFHVYVTHCVGSQGCEDGCTLVPANCFTSKMDLQPFPLGIRIDYVLYKGLSHFVVKCDSLVTTTGIAPGKSIPYSDHEAVIATLCVKRRQEAKGLGGSAVEPELVDVVNEARTEVRVGLHAAERQRYTNGRMAILALLLLLLQAAMGLSSLVGWDSQQPFPKFSFSLLSLLATVVLLVSAVLYVFHTIEVRMLQGTEEQMRLALQALQDKLGSL